MKKPIKIILAVVLILAVCAGAFLLFANGDGGECGNGVKWKYSPINKTLTVSGKGEMFNYNDMGFDPPWFEKYRQAVKKVIIKSGVTTVGDFAFDGMGIENVTLPEGVIYIGKSSFSFSGLTEVRLPETLQTIGEGAFIRSTLTELTVPENVSSIGAWAFRHCEELASVTVKGKIALLEAETFALCHSLEKLTLPSTVKSIELDALKDCTALETVIFEGTRTEWQEISIAEGNDLTEIEIVCNR